MTLTTSTTSTAASAAPVKKQRPRKQVRLKKRKFAEAAAGTGAEDEDEDSRAAKEHQKQQPKKLVEKPKPQEKQQLKVQQKSDLKKRKADHPADVETGGKKPRLSKNKRAKANAAEENPEEEAVVGEGAEGVDSEVIPKKEPRFIVFIGNLPYTATKAALEKHFAAVQPKSIRVISSREDPQKCKGFAFLEFEGYDRMQSCLLKFHHTIFNDGSGDRKINVELTAGGGGGKSKARKTKLEAKNQKLDEQRKRKIEEEEKLKAEKKAKQPQASDNEGQARIHPSRRLHVR